MSHRSTDPLDWDVARSRGRGTKRWSVHDDDVIDLTVAEMDLPVAGPIMAAVGDAVERQGFGYPVPADRSPLPAIAADWLTTVHGLDARREDVVLLPELMSGVRNAVRTLTRPGSPVVVPTPTYRSFFGAVELADRATVQTPMLRDDGRYRLDLDAIDAALADGAGAVLLCHPANPVGRVFAPAELRALADVVERHAALVISDEIHAPIRFVDRFTPYASLTRATRDHTVTLFSATKAWNVPGLRCGFAAVTNPDHRERWARLPGAATGGVSPLGMAASAAAFEHGGPWLAAALEVIGAGRERVAAAFAAAGLPEVYTPGEATYLAWLDLRRLGLDDPAAPILADARVALTPGPDHGAGGAGFARMNLATPATVLDQAVERIIAVARGAAQP